MFFLHEFDIKHVLEQNNLSNAFPICLNSFQRLNVFLSLRVSRIFFRRILFYRESLLEETRRFFSLLCYQLLQLHENKERVNETGYIELPSATAAALLN